MSIAPYFEDIRLFLSNSSDFLGAMHMNLQADNAYLWKDEEGDLDAGIFDWCLELKDFFFKPHFKPTQPQKRHLLPVA